MPDFMMPPEPEPRAESPQAPIPPGALRPPPVPTDAGPADAPTAGAAARRAPHRSWQLLAAVALVGVLLGAGMASVAQRLDAAAADGDRSRLEAEAMRYLAAIADGRADDATRMVPIEETGSMALLSDVVLAGAERITEPTSGYAQIDGDAARIEVGFLLGHVQVTRTLSAVRDGSGWRLTSSLAERVTNHGGSAVSLDEVPMPPGDALLYPALYATDEANNELISARSVIFGVDGDPSTAVEIFPEIAVQHALARLIEPVALAFASACQLSERCGLQDGALEWIGEIQAHSTDPRAADVSVFLFESDAAYWPEIRIRGDFTAPQEDWECGLVRANARSVSDWMPCSP